MRISHLLQLPEASMLVASYPGHRLLALVGDKTSMLVASYPGQHLLSLVVDETSMLDCRSVSLLPCKCLGTHGREHAKPLLGVLVGLQHQQREEEEAGPTTPWQVSRPHPVPPCLCTTDELMSEVLCLGGEGREEKFLWYVLNKRR